MRVLTGAAVLGIGLWLLAGLSGCSSGPTKVVVTGKIVDGGQPLKLEGEEFEEGAAAIELEFYPLDESGQFDKQAEVYAASVNSDGTFTVSGIDGNGIPVGKYRVALRCLVESEEGEKDVWDGRFEPSNSPFTVEITEQNHEVVVDVSQGGGGGGESSGGEE